MYVKYGCSQMAPKNMLLDEETVQKRIFFYICTNLCSLCDWENFHENSNYFAPKRKRKLLKTKNS